MDVLTKPEPTTINGVVINVNHAAPMGPDSPHGSQGPQGPQGSTPNKKPVKRVRRDASFRLFSSSTPKSKSPSSSGTTPSSSPFPAQPGGQHVSRPISGTPDRKRPAESEAGRRLLQRKHPGRHDPAPGAHRGSYPPSRPSRPPRSPWSSQSPRSPRPRQGRQDFFRGRTVVVIDRQHHQRRRRP